MAVAFAYVGARVVYGLGRQVAAARELGSYHLEERLGQGGMGEVCRARHRMLARPAAIKLIRASAERDGRSVVSAEAVRRFEREAQVIARLRSPHTVDLFDFGVADNGAFYYVMKLLEGLDADTLVRRFGPVPAERAVYLLNQVCHSLPEAESCGLIHRDIKPANIFICRYGKDRDFVKVLDFRAGEGVRRTQGRDPELTRDNMVHGIPAFIAPEQALGGADLDGRGHLTRVSGCGSVRHVARSCARSRATAAYSAPMDRSAVRRRAQPTLRLPADHFGPWLSVLMLVVITACIAAQLGHDVGAERRGRAETCRGSALGGRHAGSIL